jgi:hypothetical protein
MAVLWTQTQRRRTGVIVETLRRQVSLCYSTSSTPGEHSYLALDFGIGVEFQFSAPGRKIRA